jgi:hypothetical protein
VIRFLTSRRAHAIFFIGFNIVIEFPFLGVVYVSAKWRAPQMIAASLIIDIHLSWGCTAKYTCGGSDEQPGYEKERRFLHAGVYP